MKENNEEQLKQNNEEQLKLNNEEDSEEQLKEWEEQLLNELAQTPWSHLEAEMLRDAWRINQEEEQRMAENREKIEKEKGKEVLLQ